MTYREWDIDIAGRIATLEEVAESHDIKINEHESALRGINQALTKLAGEVGGIKKAIYVIAMALSAQVPALQSVGDKIKLILGF